LLISLVPIRVLFEATHCLLEDNSVPFSPRPAKASRRQNASRDTTRAKKKTWNETNKQHFDKQTAASTNQSGHKWFMMVANRRDPGWLLAGFGRRTMFGR
jgi:hypothetical protein